MDRTELLQKLRNIQKLINSIINTSAKQINILAQYRQTEAEISFNGAKNKTKATMFILYGGLLLFFLLQALLGGGGIVDLILFAALGGYCFFWKSKPRSKLKVIAWGLLALLSVYSLIAGMRNLLTTIVLLIMLAIVVIVGLAIVRRMNADTAEKNAATIAHNTEVNQQYNETVQQLNKLQKELREAGEGWYPPSYYCKDAADFFVNAISNFRADSIKEVVNLYESEGHKKRMEAGQQQIINGQRLLLESNDRIIEGQQIMLGQMIFANVLNMANLQAIREESANIQLAVNSPRTIRFK